MTTAAGIACHWHSDAGAADGGAFDCSAPLSLADFCAPPGRECSGGFSAMRDRFCGPEYGLFSTQRQPNRCGGQSLLTRKGNITMRFDYDGSGQLRSVQHTADFPHGACMRTEYIYDQPCELVDTARPACTGGSEDAGT